jgi:large subunit ribosomal protein L29
MQAPEIRAMSDGEVEEALENLRQEVFNLRIQHVIGQLADPSRMQAVRRDIARLKTVRRERELWAAYELDSGEGEA